MTGPSYFVIRDFLPPSQFQLMESALPDMSEVSGASRSHKDIFGGGIEFEQLLYKSPDWRNFNEAYMRSKRFWFDMYSQFDNTALKLDEKHFTPTCLEARNGKILSKGFSPFLYPRFDIGYGIEGYGLTNGGRGIHIDFKQRIFSLVWYFSDQADFEGGELDLYSKDIGGFSLVERIPLEKNTAVGILQDENGWHAVNPVTKCKSNKPRIAVYMSLSCTQSVWRNRK